MYQVDFTRIDAFCKILKQQLNFVVMPINHQLKTMQRSMPVAQELNVLTFLVYIITEPLKSLWYLDQSYTS